MIEQQQRSGHLQQLKKPSKLKLVRMYYRYFRKQHKTTSMWWWTVNAVAQVGLDTDASTGVALAVDAVQAYIAHCQGREMCAVFKDLSRTS